MSDVLDRKRERPAFDPPPRARGTIALRGLLVGAVGGGFTGYLVQRLKAYGAVVGPIVGAVIGEPIGMVMVLLATPLSGVTHEHARGLTTPRADRHYSRRLRRAGDDVRAAQLNVMRSEQALVVGTASRYIFLYRFVPGDANGQAQVVP